MFPRVAVLSLALGLAGCATTFTPQEIARAQEMNQHTMEMMQQSATAATQNANLVMMMNMNALMVQPVMMAPPAPMP